MRVWRLTRRPFADLSGAGAELLGGRWTSPRMPVVYAAVDAALAALEVRANLDLDFALVPDDYVLLGIDTNYLGYEDAPPLTDGDECRAFGDRWWRRAFSPSARSFRRHAGKPQHPHQSPPPRRPSRPHRLPAPLALCVLEVGWAGFLGM